jgi:hypothetical protein
VVGGFRARGLKNGLARPWREHGRPLFRTERDAMDFARITDARVPEHAPFHVHGLHLLTTRRG